MLQQNLLPVSAFNAHILEDIFHEHTNPSTLLMYAFTGRKKALATDIAFGYTPKKLQRFAKITSKTESPYEKPPICHD